MKAVSALDVSCSVSTSGVKQGLTEKMARETPWPVLSSLINERLEQCKVHVVSHAFTRAVTTTEIALRGRFDKKVPRVGLVDPRLGPKFVERGRELLEPGREGRGIHANHQICEGRSTHRRATSQCCCTCSATPGQST